MSSGLAIHIGLDEVDPNAYAGWSGTLDAAENDAKEMAKLSKAAGFKSRVLLTRAATASAVLSTISKAAEMLVARDMCVITYAGHGGQLDDLDSNEADSRDETWVLHDRELLDDEIYAALCQFTSGVRVLVVSDSCHSGTVIRDFYRTAITQSREIQRSYRQVAPKVGARSEKPVQPVQPGKIRIRAVPPDVQYKVLSANRSRYKEIRSRTPSRDAVVMRANVLLLSGCQDNQSSLETDGHGVFTASLLDNWDDGSFQGDYNDLIRAIRSDLPPTQSPNLHKEGPVSGFDRERPFTIGAGATSGPVTDDPNKLPNGQSSSGTHGTAGSAANLRLGILVDKPIGDLPDRIRKDLEDILRDVRV